MCLRADFGHGLDPATRARARLSLLLVFIVSVAVISTAIVTIAIRVVAVIVIALIIIAMIIPLGDFAGRRADADQLCTSARPPDSGQKITHRKSQKGDSIGKCH